jgi:separase
MPLHALLYPCSHHHFWLLDLVGLPWESMPLLRTHSVSRLPSLDFAFGKAIVERNFSDAYYVLNPSKDLTGTQCTLYLACQASVTSLSSLQ